MTTTVNSIDHIESTSYNGVGLIRVYLQPGANIDLAISQIVAVNQTILRTLPPGIYPPLVVQYDASSVPILQLGLSSSTLTEQELYDYGQNFIRTRLSTVPGISVPLPYGGKVRGVMVDLNPGALFGKGLSATDVSNALNLQNLILPTGTVKVGTREYLIQLNSSPELLTALDNMPIKTVNGAPVYMRDVAQVRDGYQVQTNIVRTDGQRSAQLTVLRHGGASTLTVVDGVKKLLPAVAASLPTSLKITPLFDQSLFVRASVSGVVREATIAACLTGLMILLFLGSWRSTLIVCLSIPLSILTSLIILGLLGQTINVMTLGGLALAVGILVDDATVEIENVHRNMGMKGKTLVRAILDGAQQIAVPAFVSTLCICIVFVPVLMLSGAAKYLFTPLSMAVVFAMLTLYLLTRTVVPTLVHYLLPVEIPLYQGGEAAAAAARAPGPIADLVFRQQVMDTVSGVARLYTDLVSLNEDVKVKQEALRLAEGLYEDNKNQVDQGTQAPIEVTRANAAVAVSRQALINAEGLVRQQELIVKTAITRGGLANPQVLASHIIPTDVQSVPGQQAVQPLADLVDAALKNRPDLAGAGLQVENSEISLQGSLNAVKPQLDVVGTAQNSGMAGNLNPLAGAPTGGVTPGGYGTVLGQLFQRNYPSYGIGLQLTLPLRNRVAQADAVRDELQVRQAQVRRQQLQDQVRLEVADAEESLLQARASYEASVEARRLQEQSVNVEQQTFDVGLSTNLTVIQYQNYLAQARSTEVASKGAYIKAQIALERATGTILDTHHVAIDEAYKGKVARQPSAVPGPAR